MWYIWYRIQHIWYPHYPIFLSRNLVSDKLSEFTRVTFPLQRVIVHSDTSLKDSSQSSMTFAFKYMSTVAFENM